MKKCPECNNMVEDGLKICGNCGYPLEEINQESNDENNNVDVTVESAEYEEVDELATEENVDNTVQDETNENVVETDNVDSDNCVEEVAQSSDESDYVSEEKPKKQIDKRKMLKIACVIVLAFMLISLISTNSKYNALSKKYSDTKSELYKVKEEKEALLDENKELKAQNIEVMSENDELKNGASKQLADIKNAYEKGEWQTVIDLTAKLHEKYNGSAEDNEAQKLAQTSQSKIDEAKAAKAAEEAKGYETGITYDQLARTPDDFKGKKVKFYGKVVQVIEGDDSIQIRLAVNDDYDAIVLGEYRKSIVTSRVLEDDHITIYGSSVGTISYKSTLGGTITIPGVYVEKIEQ